MSKERECVPEAGMSAIKLLDVNRINVYPQTQLGMRGRGNCSKFMMRFFIPDNKESKPSVVLQL